MMLFSYMAVILNKLVRGVPLLVWSAAGWEMGCFPAEDQSSLLFRYAPCGVSLALSTAGVNPFPNPP